MKNEYIWLIWIPLIVLVVMLFPKSCGFKNPIINESFKCSGFNAPYLSLFDKSNNPQQWCSGICFSSSIVKNISINNDTSSQSNLPNPVTDITGSFGKVIPAIFLILLAVGIVKWIGSMTEKLGKK